MILNTPVLFSSLGRQHLRQLHRRLRLLVAAQLQEIALGKALDELLEFTRLVVERLGEDGAVEQRQEGEEERFHGDFGDDYNGSSNPWLAHKAIAP